MVSYARRETVPHRLPTNTTARHYPIHRWLNFVAGFSPEFVSAAIEQSGTPRGGLLLDPFAGLATAPLVANFEGINAVGFEPHPFFFDIGLAKTQVPDLTQVDIVESVFQQTPAVANLPSVWSPKALEFLQKLIGPKSLSRLAGARLAESDCPASARNLYRLMLSRTLEAATGSKTDGIYKAPESTKRPIDIEEAAAKIIGELRNDLACLPVGMGSTKLYAQSSEHMPQIPSGTVDLCVTSPPYLNNFDFAEMTRMELYFWNYAANWREITDTVRAKLIVNTTTAPTTERRRQDHWRALTAPELLDELDGIIAELSVQRRQRAGRKEYDSLVLPYFAQMGLVLKEVTRVLKAGGPIHLVVSDAALYGVHIRTEKLLATLMTSCGLEVKEIIRLRDRGGRWVLAKRQGAADGLGEFHIHAKKVS